MGTIRAFTPAPEDVKETSLLDAIRKATRSSAGISALGLPPKTPILGDWFKEGDCGFIYAPRGLGKTWLSMGIACAIANGTTLGSWKAHGKNKVVYIDGEMSQDGIVERLEGMDAGENLTVLNHEVLFHLSEKTLNIADKATQQAITEYLLEMQAKALLLDNLSCLASGMEESSSDSWELVLPWLLQLRRLKIAVVIVAHAGRNGNMRGTSRREDSAFWILKLTPTGDDKTGGERQATFISHFDKERNSGKAQQPIEWTFETDASGIVKVTHKIADTLTVFRQWVEVGLNSATEIAEAMDLSKGQVSKLAKRAMEAGWLVNENRRYKLVSRTPA